MSRQGMSERLCSTALVVGLLLAVAGLALAGPDASARQVHFARQAQQAQVAKHQNKHAKRRKRAKRHKHARKPHKPANPQGSGLPASGGNRFTLSGNVDTTIDNEARGHNCIGQSISGTAEGADEKGAEIVTSGVLDFGTFTLPDLEVVGTFAILYSPSGIDVQSSKYYSWTDPTGTITLTQTAHGGVKGSLDLTLQPGYIPGTDSSYQNEATSSERITGSWSCPL